MKINLSKSYFEDKADEYQDISYQLSDILVSQCVNFNFSKDEVSKIKSVIFLLNKKTDMIEAFVDNKDNEFYEVDF